MTKKQPTSHNKRKHEMTTTRNAAAPQFRFACIQELRDGLTFEGQEQRDEFSTKDEDIEYDLLVPK